MHSNSVSLEGALPHFRKHFLKCTNTFLSAEKRSSYLFSLLAGRLLHKISVFHL